MTQNTSAVYTLQELALVLSVSEQTIRRMFNRGELKGFKIGKQWRILKKDFEAYLKNRCGA